MYWVIQNDLFREYEQHANLIAALERLGLPHSVHKIVPFTSMLEPEVNPTGPVMVVGAIKLANIAKARGWQPGSFLNENFDFEIQYCHWPEQWLLNSDCQVCTFETVPWYRNQIPTADGCFFIRPVHDTKVFNGCVQTWDEFMDWHRRVVQNDEDVRWACKPDTPVLVSSAKRLFWEYRLWVVDNRVVTASAYKNSGRLWVTETVNPEALRFAEMVIRRWTPARAFVLDVAETPDGFKIIEVNNLNSAGFYACNIARVVEAIEGMGYV